MTSVSYPLRIPERLMEIVELRTKEEYVDKSTALRQLIYQGATDYILSLYEKGRVSLSLAAELLDKSVHDILRLCSEKGIRTGADQEQQKSSEKIANKLGK